MASLPVRRIVLRTLCQATEEENRVRHALNAAAPRGGDRREAVMGQFGQPIVILTRMAERADDLTATWGRWREAGLFPSLLANLERRIDEDGVLHFRLDKQEAFRDRLVLAEAADSIDIHVKLKAYPASPEEIRRVARTLLEGAV